MFGPRCVEREQAPGAVRPKATSQPKDGLNQLTSEEQEFYGENPEESHTGYPTRYPRKAKNIRVGQAHEDDESYDSNEDEDMIYHDDWIPRMVNLIRAFNLLRVLDEFVPRTTRLSQRGSVSSKAFRSPFKPNTAIVLIAKRVQPAVAAFCAF